MNKDEISIVYKAITDSWNVTRETCLDKELNHELIAEVDKALCDKAINICERGSKDYLLRYQIASAILTYLTHTKEGHH